MDIKTFIETFAEPMASDATLEDWADVNFGEKVKVFKDFDSDDIPDEDEAAPYMLFANPGKESHNERHNVDWEFLILMTINKDGYKTRVEPNVKEPAGVDLMSDFVAHVQRILIATLPNGWAMGFSTGIDNIEDLPNIHAGLYVSITQKTYTGTNALE